MFLSPFPRVTKQIFKLFTTLIPPLTPLTATSSLPAPGARDSGGGLADPKTLHLRCKCGPSGHLNCHIPPEDWPVNSAAYKRFYCLLDRKRLCAFRKLLFIGIHPSSDGKEAVESKAVDLGAQSRTRKCERLLLAWIDGLCELGPPVRSRLSLLPILE